MVLRWLMRTDAPAATVLIRIVVGAIFLSEGIQKFLDPQGLGAGRFAKIGIPSPEVMGPLVGGVEIVCGALLLLGLATRFACVPLLISMTVAIVSTKGPILAGHSFGGFALQKVDKDGIWSFMHEARTDLLMLFGVAFLMAVGAGPWSIDASMAKGKSHRAGDTGVR